MAKIAILTSGGDAPGMNACVRAIVRAGLKLDCDMFVVYEGYKGLVEGKIEQVDRNFVSDIITRGGTILGSARLPEFKEENVEVFAWKTVKGTYSDTEHVKFTTLPAVKVASCVVKGSYEQMPEVYGAVISWVTDNGYEPDGAMFNIYHVSPHETQDENEFITEVCYPIK